SGLAVGIELASDEIPRAYPTAVVPLPERKPGAGCAGSGREHLDSLERFLDAARRQWMRVGKGVKEDGGEIAVDDRHAVFRSSAVTLLEPVEEVLAEPVARVVLVDADPSDDRVPHDRVDPRVLKCRAEEAGRVPSELLQRGIDEHDAEPEAAVDDGL